MKFKVKNKAGIYLGSLMGIILFAICFWGVNFSLPGEDDILKTMLLIPTYIFLGVFIVAVIGGVMLKYSTNDDGVQIRWGFRKIDIAWDEIEHIIKVKGRSNFFSVFGISWPGYIIGLYNASGLGVVRMYGTYYEDGFVYLKTSKGFYGLTPENMNEILKAISEKTGKEIEDFDMDSLSEEDRGPMAAKDRSYKLLYSLNVIFLILLAAYLALFFPGSNAPRFLILLLVLGIALFFFNTSNAARLYQFSPNGGYGLLLLSIIITGTFLILTVAEISF